MRAVRMADVWMAHLEELAINAAEKPTTPVLALPAPVQRYFDVALQHGAWGTRSAELTQAGDFLLQPPSLWRPFTATQSLKIAPPGFIWDASVRVLPGVAIHVRDAFINGVGSIEAKLLGRFTLASVQGTPAVALGSLQRYLAEAPWCPAALLPNNGVAWTPLETSSARATVMIAGTRASLDFHFGVNGLIERVHPSSRPRIVGREVIGTPWQGHFSEYAERDGMINPARRRSGMAAA
jgi:hypothetical protein